MFKTYIILSIVTFLRYSQCQVTPYRIPDPKIEVFTPKGIRVSIPDTSGVQLFGFHGKINAAFNSRNGVSEPGEIDISTIESTSGLWIVEDTKIQLEINDTIYYWLFVQYQNLGFRKENGRFEVKSLLNKDGTVSVGSTINSGSNNQPNNPGTTSCEPTATIVNGASTCRGQLIFSEEFSQPNIDNRKWNIESKIAQAPDYEFVSYQRRPQNIYVQDSLLNIVPTVENDSEYVSSGTLDLTNGCTGRVADDECSKIADTFLILPPVVSARITSFPYFSFVYGKIEIRAKLPAGDWIYPELYLLPKNQEYGSGYQSGRIILAYSRGNVGLKSLDGRDLSSKVLTGGLMMGKDDPLRSIVLKSKINPSKAWSDDFHIFTYVWRQDGITVSVDSETFGIISIPSSGLSNIAKEYNAKYASKWKTANAPFDKEFYIALGVGVGGVSDFPDSENKPWRNKDPKLLVRFWEKRNVWEPTWSQNSKLQVDYVRVWAL